MWHCTPESARTRSLKGFSGGAEINAANIAKLIGATGAAVPAYYPMLYARMLQSNDVSKIIASGGGGGGGGGGAAAAGGAAAGGAAAGGDAGGKVTSASSIKCTWVMGSLRPLQSFDSGEFLTRPA